ncbi:hypothetical protein N0V90_008812 [Kalmusia sp. IMI 367209]|nr:hypothetical protein N0V90_008812 [Kalmusia sp. IMI 367209]
MAHSISKTATATTLKAFQIYPQETFEAAVWVFETTRVNDDDYVKEEKEAQDIIKRHKWPITLAFGSSLWSKVESIRQCAKVILLHLDYFSDDNERNGLFSYLGSTPLFYDSGLAVKADGLVLGSEVMTLLPLSLRLNKESLSHRLQRSASKFKGWMNAAYIKSELYPPAFVRVGNWKAHQKTILSVIQTFSYEDDYFSIDMRFFQDDDADPNDMSSNVNNDISPGAIQVTYAQTATLRTHNQSLTIDINPNGSNDKVVEAAQDMWMYMVDKGYAKKLRLEDVVRMAEEIVAKSEDRASGAA